MNLEELKQAEMEARTAFLEAEQALAAAKREDLEAAQKRIRDAHKEEDLLVHELSMVHWHAKRAREEAEVALASERILKLRNGAELHLGDHVVRDERGRHDYIIKTVRGVVEVATHSTVFPDNMSSYSRPDPGELFIRLLTKDGKPGKLIEKSAAWQDWRIDTPATANTPQETAK